MPERPASERTEPPTPERLRKARREGKVAQSMELPSALVLGALLLVAALTASGLWTYFVHNLRQACALGGGGGPIDVAGMAGLLRARGTEALWRVAPFMLASTAAAVFAGVLVGGWTVAPKAMAVKPERMNPVTGLRNLVSTQSLVRLGVSLVKVTILTAVVVHYLRGQTDRLLALSWATPVASLGETMDLVFGVVVRIALALAAVALADVLYQRWQWRKDLRMTKQEVKEERREHEPAPEVRGRLRARQYELLQKRMLQDVPAADVVVTNPTHVAVALAYKAGETGAPRVVAKGADWLSEKIKEIARAHGVPVLARPELARTIYRTIEVGDAIPEALYVAVAEVLSLVYRLRREARGTT